MSEEIKKFMEDVKETISALAKTIKDESDNRQKLENITDELKQRQEKLEIAKSSQRRGVFAGEEEDPRGALKAQDINALVSLKTKDEGIVELQRANDDILMVSQILNIHPTQTKLYNAHKRTNSFLRKAMYSTSTGTGDEWVPTGYSPELYDLVRLSLKCAALHPSVNMPTNPYIYPVVASDSEGYKISESTADAAAVTAASLIRATNVGTTNFTLTAVKIGARMVFSEEMAEDAIVPVLPVIRQNLVTAMTGAIENAIINGDDNGTHMDSDTTNAYDARQIWDGYRLNCQSASKTDGSAFTGENFNTMTKKMGVYGIDPSKLAIVTSIAGYSKFLMLKDSAGTLLTTTLDKYGPSATIFNGELGKVFGMPIIVSEKMRQNLNATAVYDGTTTTKTIVLCIYKPGFMIGNRRGLTLKTADEITTDQTVLVATQRLAFSNIYAAATNYVVGMLYNITS